MCSLQIQKHDNDDAIPKIDLPGLKSQKELLETCILYPLCSKTTNLPMNPPKGIVVYGATGTGKTRLCNELGRALRGRAQFISVSCPSLLSKVVGETEKNISQIFRRARSLAPSVLFLDHIESLAPRRGNDNTTERTMDRWMHFRARSRRASLSCPSQISEAPGETVPSVPSQSDPPEILTPSQPPESTVHST